MLENDNLPVTRKNSNRFLIFHLFCISYKQSFFILYF